jgi:hypothetical protein
MKILLITLGMAMAVNSCGQSGKTEALPAKQTNPVNTVPGYDLYYITVE